VIVASCSSSSELDESYVFFELDESRGARGVAHLTVASIAAATTSALVCSKNRWSSLLTPGSGISMSR